MGIDGSACLERESKLNVSLKETAMQVWGRGKVGRKAPTRRMLMRANEALNPASLKHDMGQREIL